MHAIATRDRKYVCMYMYIDKMLTYFKQVLTIDVAASA